MHTLGSLTLLFFSLLSIMQIKILWGIKIVLISPNVSLILLKHVRLVHYIFICYHLEYLMRCFRVFSNSEHISIPVGVEGILLFLSLSSSLFISKGLVYRLWSICTLFLWCLSENKKIYTFFQNSSSNKSVYSGFT